MKSGDAGTLAKAIGTKVVWELAAELSGEADERRVRDFAPAPYVQRTERIVVLLQRAMESVKASPPVGAGALPSLGELALDTETMDAIERIERARRDIGGVSWESFVTKARRRFRLGASPAQEASR